MTRLRPEPLTGQAFEPYGDVIEVANAKEQRQINYGHTIRYHDLARLDLSADQGQSLISIFRSTPLETPIPVKVMEAHPLSSQAFYPLSNRPYLVVVAGRGQFDANNLRVFLAGPNQGVNYHKGCWHHYSLALDGVSDFLVIDRDGPGSNCDEVILNEEIVIEY